MSFILLIVPDQLNQSEDQHLLLSGRSWLWWEQHISRSDTAAVHWFGSVWGFERFKPAIEFPWRGVLDQDQIVTTVCLAFTLTDYSWRENCCLSSFLWMVWFEVIAKWFYSFKMNVYFNRYFNVGGSWSKSRREAQQYLLCVNKERVQMFKSFLHLLDYIFIPTAVCSCLSDCLLLNLQFIPFNSV